MITLKQYTSEDKEIWNKFNTDAKNSLFMFDRNYMDYHNDRFQDNSLMFYNDNDLVAILPMNVKNMDLFSHGGLTYGGFITGDRMKQHIMNDCFDSLLNYCRENNFRSILYKPIPHCYHTQSAEEDKYGLFIHEAQLKAIEVSALINLNNPLKMPKGRKAQISRAKREGVSIEEKTEECDFRTFIDLENDVLTTRHNVSAAHNGAELYLLHSYFPDKIHLVAAMYEGSMIAGAVIFEYNTVIHTQYMAANDKAREIGALDLTISTVIDHYKGRKLWLDFGISTEDDGKYFNLGLNAQKEGFGGRTDVYEKWLLVV